MIALVFFRYVHDAYAPTLKLQNEYIFYSIFMMVTAPRHRCPSVRPLSRALVLVLAGVLLPTCPTAGACARARALARVRAHVTNAIPPPTRPLITSPTGRRAFRGVINAD